MKQKGFIPILIVVAVLIAVAVGGYFVYQKSQTTPSGTAKPSPTDQVACTQDAKLCPDGSYVARVGPNCEFTPCPSPTNSKELELIKIACAKTTKDDVLKIDMTITDPSSKYSGQFAAGSYRTKDTAGGSRWLAAKVNDEWVCPSIGNGIPLCSEVDPYNFPLELINSCRDNKDILMDRSTSKPM